MHDPISEFWDYFKKRRHDLNEISGADNPVYEDILARLQEVNPGLYFEFCTTPGVNELILTADGNAELFELVDEIVSRAPEIEGWKIFALKPKLGFPVKTCWEGVEVAIADVVVVPVHRESGELGLQLYVEGVTPEAELDIHNALLRAIDSGLGERCFAERVQATWIHPISELPDAVLSFRLPQLDEYLGETPGDVADSII